jgi:hypothetical protein
LVKDVWKSPRQARERLGRTKNRHLCREPASEPTNIVDAMRMIGVFVRDEERIHLIDAGAKKL